ncbi:STY0301 family protein [Snodgrassella alvi]|uniref:Uncharacterized protein n=1 Tax=Snodgrassella alvi TaxID=1196083 RepID=A0A2N9WUJ6_9NEIS|nr:STY0301 family protein [Snodgrassella alvi]PIT16221.1 hypothetical protein BGI33_05075 [Snodgrassella alvi]PIT16270.1 hypothetical protein BGI32_04920 [Snodgrassella alvi]PIT19214.1 hypothetical protein BGI34_03075 [Snodgrassella alvi]
MKGRIFSKIMLVLFWLGIKQSAIAYELICPDSVLVKAATPELKLIPQNWEVSEYKDSLLRLDGAGIFSGKPVDLAQLKPKYITIKGKKRYPAWDIDSKFDLDGVGYWFSCSYNRDQVQLTRRIDSAMKVCWTVYSKDSQGGIRAKLECQ